MPIFRNEFPDIKWLKNEINNRFQRKEGWPNVIINTLSNQAYRPDIKGPLSLFMNIKGESACSVGRHFSRILESQYFLSNQGENYTLEIENPGTETFNIHFGEKFLEQVYQALILPEDKILSNPEDSLTSLEFYSKLYEKDEKLFNWIQDFYKTLNSGYCPDLFIEEQLTELLKYLLRVHRNIVKDVAKLPAAKASTREELYKRMLPSLDYMESYYDRDINLDELAQISFISKYHYLRLFKAAFKITPHQYLLNVRMRRAKGLLEKSDLPVGEVARRVGFEELSSFSRLFYKKEGVWPGRYRENR